MKKILLVVLLASNIISKAQTCKEVVGYYPNWQWYDRSKLVNPTSIKYNNYSVINYCFFKPETNGTISNTDSWADENLLQGQINWSTTPVSYYPNTSIIERAHNAGTKVLVSIGGWTLSDNFPQIAASATKRTTFASECNRLIRFYNFDGIDIDWEYPGFVEHSGTPADKQNFTLFMQEIRDSLTALGNQRGKTYLLTSCFSADPVKAQNIEWQNLVPIVDMINVMSYDFFGAWDCIANHNSPLYAGTSGDANFNLDACFKMLTLNYNVPSNKINLGVAFYGRSQMGATALHQSTNCTANNSIFGADEGTPLYYNAVAALNQFDQYWDNTAKVPYLLGKTGTSAAGTFVSYDNTLSVGLKAQYVRDNNALGVIIWEITGDYIESAPGSGIVGSTPLSDTINEVFCSSAVGVKESAQTKIQLYPNPASDELYIQLDSDDFTIISIVDYNGRKIMEWKLNTLNTKLDLAELSNGLYIIEIKNENKCVRKKLIKQ